MAATKTLATLYALAETAIATLVNGAAYTLPSGALTSTVELFAANVATTAPGTSGSLPPNAIRIQGCTDSTDDSKWVDFAVVSLGTTASVTTTANGAISAAAVTATLTGSGTFSARTGLLYIKDSTTVGEWVLGSQATTTLTVPSPGIINSHSNGVSLYDQAMRFALTFDTTGLLRLRVVVDNNQQSTGPTIAVYASVSSFNT